MYNAEIRLYKLGGIVMTLNMTKRIVSLVLTMLLFLSNFPMTVFAEEIEDLPANYEEILTDDENTLEAEEPSPEQDTVFEEVPSTPAEEENALDDTTPITEEALEEAVLAIDAGDDEIAFSDDEDAQTWSLRATDLETTIEKQIRAFADSIDQSGADDSAAKALATHGMVGNGKKLSVGKSHSLTATLMNSEQAQTALTAFCTSAIRSMQQLDLTQLENTRGAIIWYDTTTSTYHLYAYDAANKEAKRPDWTLVGTTHYTGKRNAYDESLKWMAGNTSVVMSFKRTKTTTDTATYQVALEFKDRFDFSIRNNDKFKNLISGLGSLLFVEFDWSSKVTFNLNVPYTCPHETQMYRITYDSDSNTMTSDATNGWQRNDATRHTYTGSKKESYYFELEKPIRLHHDLPWVMEYDVCKPSSFGFAPLSNTSYTYPVLLNISRSILAVYDYEAVQASQKMMDQYDLSSANQHIRHYYGTSLNDRFTYSTKKIYTLRLENELRPKGGNMIYLTVLETETGNVLLDHVPMDDYYIYESWIKERLFQNECNEWVSGKDLIFNYIGYKTYRFSADHFELRVWENGKDSAPVSHFEKTKVTAPTCTAKGYTTYACDLCGYTYKGSYVSATGHKFGSWSQTSAPTCADAGVESRSCAICKKAETRSIPAIGHNLETVTTSPTCTEAGFRKTSCDRCEYSKIEEIPATGHTYETAITPPTCTTDGYTTYTCHCGDSYQDSSVPAFGHSEVIDEAIVPNCTETGLTEGSHCSICEEILIPQELLPVSHSFELRDEQVICAVCNEELNLHISQDYILLMKGQRLTLDVSPVNLANNIEWVVDGEDGIVTTASNTITAVSSGTVYLQAKISEDGFESSVRFRVDVADAQVTGIHLSNNAATTELFSTNYTGLKIYLQLTQSASLLSLRESAVPQEDLGVAIEKAYFTDATMADLFELRILNDRNVIIVPTYYAVKNPAEVGKSYTSTIKAVVLGEEIESAPLTLTVKKTLPKLKASVPEFNSFYSGDSQKIVVDGVTVTSIIVDSSKTTALPNWLDLSEDGTLTLNEKAPLANTSAKAYLHVNTEEWRIPAAVAVNIKNTYKERNLKLSASSATFAENSSGIAMNLLCTDKDKTLADLNVTGITAPEGYIVKNFSIADGSFTLKRESNDKTSPIKLGVTFSDTAVVQPLSLSVKTANITLKASTTVATLNISRSDSAVIDISATPADYQLINPTITLTGTEMVNGKKVTVNKLTSGELNVSFEEGKLRISTTPNTPDKATYKLSISAGGSKAVAITIRTVSTVPTVTFKAKGTMDLSFPMQTAVISPIFKDCGNGFDSFECTVAETKGKTVVREDVSSSFEVVKTGASLNVRCVDETINTANSYVFKLKLIQDDGNSVENTITLKVKRTAVKLKLSTATLSLNKLIGDGATIDVTCTTKGYKLTEPSIEVKDRENNNAADQLNISYHSGKLNITTNEETSYGATYKVLIKANDYAPATTLTINIPKKDKATVTVTVKATGTIDVIREESSLVLTPTYKNVTAQAEKVESLIFYKTIGKVTEEVNELFSYEVDPNGTITIRKAENSLLDHSAKYTVKLITHIADQKICESKALPISVKMGGAKLTPKASDTLLFAQDRYDRIVFRVDSGDKTLNEVVKVEIKDEKYKDVFKIYNYGNGKFAVGFKDNVINQSLIGNKARLDVNLNLNIFIAGNETTKPNTTAKLKLAIVK